MKATVFSNRLAKAGCFRGAYQRGVTLVELVISIVVVAIALAALLSNFSGAAGRSANPMWQARATQLAQAYLDEITAMRFQENSPLGGGSAAGCSSAGPETGETSRALYDDVDDYNGINEQASFLDATVPANYVGYQVAVTVRCVNAQNLTASNSKLIELTITAPNGSSLLFSTFRGNF